VSFKALNLLPSAIFFLSNRNIQKQSYDYALIILYIQYYHRISEWFDHFRNCMKKN